MLTLGSYGVVDGSVVSSIEAGLCVLVGIGVGDTPADMEYIVRKILNSRLFQVCLSEHTWWGCDFIV
jgi:D-Tyr-tRNAtyr deacylase